MTTNLPATMSGLVNSLETATTAVTNASGDMAFVRLLKDGMWVYGGDDAEVTEDSLWAVNPESFAMGFQAWSKDGDLEGEEMALVTEPPILKGNLPDVGATWKAMLSCQLACIKGDEKGLVVQYGTTAKGGIKEVNKLMQTLVKRIKSPDANGKFVPVVILSCDSYKHKKYGKIYTPILDIQKWVDLSDGLAEVEEAPAEPETEVAAETTPDPAAPPARRRRRGQS